MLATERGLLVAMTDPRIDVAWSTLVVGERGTDCLLEGEGVSGGVR